MRGFPTARAAIGRLALLLAVCPVGAQPLVRPVAGAGAEAKTLLVYANTRPAYALADGLEALKLHLLRVATRLETVAVSNAVPERVAGASHLVVYCPQYFPDLPRDVLRLIAEANKPVLWIGFGADRLAEFEPFKGRFEVSAFAAAYALTNLQYLGRDWSIPIDPWIPVALATNSGSQILISCPDQADNRQTNRPISWKTAQAMFFMTDPSVGPIGFLFEDLLLDFYQVKEVPPRRVFVRIEDYHCRGDHRAFRRMVDYLLARGHPFMVGVVPEYRDPATGELLDLESQPEFVEALRYAQKRGGRLVMRGASPPAENEVGNEQQLWDRKLDRPSAGARPESLRPKLQKATRAMLRQGLLVLAWETPDYAASHAVYPEIAKVFSTAVERVQLSDATHLANADIGGLTVDRYGRLIVPENLGYALEAPAGFDGGIAARARMLTPLRGTVAGCFIHAYQPIENLAALVEMLESFQVPFLDLAELDNRVQLPEALLLTGNAQGTVTLRNAAVRWQAYDRAGRRLEEKQEPTTWSGQRTFQRKGAGDYELFEFSETDR